MDLRFADILDNWRRLIYRRVALGGTTSLYNNAATIVPWFLLAGRFFSGALKLGDIIQASSAFDQVRSYLSVLINNYGTFASWQATVNRISGFATALNQIRTPTMSQSQSLSLTDFRAALLGSSPGLPAAHQHIELEDSGGSTLRVQHLATRAPRRAARGAGDLFEIAPGERVLFARPFGQWQDHALARHRHPVAVWQRAHQQSAAAASALGAATVSAAGHAARCAVLSAGGERSP